MKHTATQYAKTLYEITEGKNPEEVDAAIGGLLKLLEKNGERRLATGIIKRFSEIYDAKKGIIEAEVVSREKLTDEAVGKIKKLVSEKYAAKEVEIRNKIDGAIKGGIIIKVGDDVMDGSVRKQLSRLKNELAA